MVSLRTITGSTTGAAAPSGQPRYREQTQNRTKWAVLVRFCVCSRGVGAWRARLPTRAAAITALGSALQLCYVRSMSEVASRELRNDTAAVLRRVRDGEDVTITVNGRPVAVLTAVSTQRRRWLPKSEFLSRLRHVQADPGLRKDLEVLAGDTTEDLGPI